MDTAQRRAFGLLAVATWFALDMIRSSGPLLSDLFDVGVSVAAGAGVATFAGGGILAWVAALLRKRFGHGPVLVALAAIVIVARFLFPVLSESTLIAVGLLGTSAALALMLVSARAAVAAGGGALALGASAFGVLGAILEQNATRTWDAVWRDDALGWALIIGLAAALGLTAWRARNDSGGVPIRGLWAYGLWMSLVVFEFGSLAFTTSQTDTRMSLGTLVAALGLAAGTVLTARSVAWKASLANAVSLLSIPAIAITLLSRGTGALLAASVAAATTTLAASRVLRSSGTGSDAAAALRTLGAGCAFGLLALLPFMAVQLDYDIPLGFPHFLALVAAAVAIALGALVSGSKIKPEPVDWWRATGVRAAAVGTGLAVVASIVTFAVHEPQGRTYTADYRDGHPIMSWNLHYGVTPGLSGGPHVDLDQIAATIRESGAQVIMLQEINRGWTLAGGTDMLEYLAGELDMEFVFVPAHDSEFGNAIFSSRPMSDVQEIVLPYGDGPQRRSAVSVRIDAVTYVVLHLQHREENTPTRVLELDSFFAQLEATGAVVVAGDFNDTPDSATFNVMVEHGYVSAQDLLAPEQNTYVGSDFNARIDYIWGTGVTFSLFDVGGAVWSDHLPLLVTTSAEDF